MPGVIRVICHSPVDMDVVRAVVAGRCACMRTPKSCLVLSCSLVDLEERQRAASAIRKRGEWVIRATVPPAPS